MRGLRGLGVTERRWGKKWLIRDWWWMEGLGYFLWIERVCAFVGRS
jgi:hypothetical protein